MLIDDSTSPEHAAAQRQQLFAFAHTSGCTVSYFGHAESLALTENLARASPRAGDAIRSLLVRGAHPQSRRFGRGRSRNIPLLLSAGARLILLDDDLCLPLRRPGCAREGLDPKSDASARACFYANMEQALVSGAEIDEDPFDLHLDVCGRLLGSRANGRYALSRAQLGGSFAVACEHWPTLWQHAAELGPKLVNDSH